MIGVVFRALSFAADRHQAQRRKGPGGAPYVNHLIEVAMLLADVAGVTDADLLVAAVLHDTVEDTETTLEEIEERFGVRVRGLVAALTDDKSLPQAERKALVLEHLETADDATKLVKLADLSSNIASFPSDWSLERCHAYLDWSKRAAMLCAGMNPALDALYEERCLATSMAIARLERE